jgi:Tol biopolymer transport system component
MKEPINQVDTGIDPALISRILSSPQFARSERMCRFLRFLAEATARGERPKESEVGVTVFDRTVGYDPKVDSIVRVEATRLRRKLKEYYESQAATGEWRIHLPPGRYELEILPRERGTAEPDAAIEPTDNSAPESILEKPANEKSSYWTRLAQAAGGALSLLVLGTVFLLARRSHSSELPEARPVTFLQGVENQPAFSSRGEKLAFTWNGDNNGLPAVWIQDLNGANQARVTHSSGREYFPVWSPDGRQLAFLRLAGGNFEIRTIDLRSKQEKLIVSLRGYRSTIPGLSWSPDGKWLASSEATGEGGEMRIVVVSVDTGQERFYNRPAENTGYLYPAFSPDGQSLAYVKAPEAAVNDVFIAAFPDGPERQITFDRAVVRGIAWSGKSELIVSSTREGHQETLWSFSTAGGNPVRLTDGVSPSFYPAVSFDGSRIAFSRRTDDINLWRHSVSSKRPADSGEAWIHAVGLDSSPQFSPDGSRIAFRSSRTGQNEVWLANRNGEETRRLTWFGGPVTGSPHWSPDGKWLVCDSRPSGNADVFAIPASGGKPQQLTSDATNEVVPSFSRDGSFVYFSSDRGGHWSMWRQPWGANGTGEARMVRDHAFAGFESPDGRYLYYVHGPDDPGLFRAPVAGGAEEPVIANLRPGMWGNWAFSGPDVFFINWVGQGSEAEAWMQRRKTDGTIEPLFKVGQPIGWDGGLAISPDAATLVYGQLDKVGADILELSNWR